MGLPGGLRVLDAIGASNVIVTDRNDGQNCESKTHGELRKNFPSSLK